MATEIYKGKIRYQTTYKELKLIKKEANELLNSLGYQTTYKELKQSSLVNAPELDNCYQTTYKE